MWHGHRESCRARTYMTDVCRLGVKLVPVLFDTSDATKSAILTQQEEAAAKVLQEDEAAVADVLQGESVA